MSDFCLFSLPHDTGPPSRVNAAGVSSSVASDTTPEGKDSQLTVFAIFVRSHIIYDLHPMFCACVVVLIVGERNDDFLSVSIHPRPDAGREHCGYTACIDAAFQSQVVYSN